MLIRGSVTVKPTLKWYASAPPPLTPLSGGNSSDSSSVEILNHLLEAFLPFMKFGASVRVPSGGHSIQNLTHRSFFYEQSACIPTQHHRSIASLHTYVTLPRKHSTCNTTLKEANNNIEAIEKVKGICSVHSCEMELSSLTAISPLDGHYWNKVKDLARYLSEYGLIYYRNLVEIKWLLKLSQVPEVVEVPCFSNEAQLKLQGLIDGFNIGYAIEVKNIKRTTNHDVKAVEYFLKSKCKKDPEIAKQLTRSFMDELVNAIYTMAKGNARVPMLSWTHGQPASPTTLGKEMLILAERLKREKQSINQAEIFGKFAGAVGNYNAHVVAYPEVNWSEVSEQFVTSLGLSFNPYVTQIERHDYMVHRFHSFIRFNNILVDFVKDIWGYISLGYFKQAGETGSSTLPHKVNPIDFENSEGNLGIANAIVDHLSIKLPVSRWQRDLTNSTVLRYIGVGLGYSLLAYKSAVVATGKLQWKSVNEAALNMDLDKSWEVLAEPIQTVMRRYGVEEPYEKLKELTRGKAITKERLAEFINRLEIPIEAKTELLKLTPHNYVGVAVRLVDDAYNKAMDVA